jgi:cell division transport system permease protein
MPYVTKSTIEQSSIHFISKDSAAKKFIADTGEDFLKFLGENPLHDAYLLNISSTYHSKEKLDVISKELEKINGVFQVFYVEGLIESINQNITRIGLLLIGLIALLLITVVLLINNTLRLALFSQRFLIRSMQLVGARKWFIQKPFLARSVSYGALSGILASGLIWVLINYANKNIEDLTEIQNEKSIMLMMALLLITGIIVAVISTFFSIKKYLNMSLDELY